MTAAERKTLCREIQAAQEKLIGLVALATDGDIDIGGCASHDSIYQWQDAQQTGLGELTFSYNVNTDIEL